MTVAPDNAGGEALSPCIGICSMDEATGWCIGCGRTRSEIAAWLVLAAGEKRHVLSQLAARKAELYEEP